MILPHDPPGWQLGGALLGPQSSAVLTIRESDFTVVGPPSYQSFLTGVYHDLLNRTPDSEGMYFWQHVLGAGESRTQVAFDILTVPPREFYQDQVVAYFSAYLHRAPEPAAIDWATGLLLAGDTLEQFEEILVGSTEYFQVRAANDNDAFLDALFHDALGRAVDPSARQFFDEELAASVSRQQVAAQIFGSDEYHRGLVAVEYDRFLHRDVEPAGLAFFAGQLDQGAGDEQMIAEIIGSEEYFQGLV